MTSRGRRRGVESEQALPRAPWPEPERWTSQDPHAQQERFDTLAHYPLTIEIPGEQPLHIPADLRPYLGRGEDHKRLMHLRCGAPRCGVLVGAVWCVSARHRGSPFIWAETKIVIDRRARPVTVQVVKMVLDDAVAHLELRSECPAHGQVAASISSLLDRLPDAATQLMEKGRSTKSVLQPRSRT